MKKNHKNKRIINKYATGGAAKSLIAGGAISGVGGMVSAIPVVGLIAGPILLGLGTLTSTLGAAFGSNINEEAVANIESNIDTMKNYTSGATTASDALSALSSFRGMNEVKVGDIGNDGIFSNAATEETNRLNYEIELANNIARSNILNEVSQLNDLEQFNKFSSLLSYGGPLDTLVSNINKRSKSNFVYRLKNPNRKYIQDWEFPDNVATHKLGYAEDSSGAIVYPSILEINGELYDFTNPIYNRGKWDALNSAIERGDTLRMSVEDAKLFTENYKKYYPKGETFKAYGGPINMSSRKPMSPFGNRFDDGGYINPSYNSNYYNNKEDNTYIKTNHIEPIKFETNDGREWDDLSSKEKFNYINYNIVTNSTIEAPLNRVYPEFDLISGIRGIASMRNPDIPIRKGSYYRVVGKDAIDDAKQIGIIRTPTEPKFDVQTLNKLSKDLNIPFKDIKNKSVNEIRELIKNSDLPPAKKLIRAKSNHGDIGFSKEEFFYKPNKNNYIIEGNENASTFLQGHHGSYSDRFNKDINAGEPVVLREGNDVSKFTYWKHKPFFGWTEHKFKNGGIYKKRYGGNDNITTKNIFDKASSISPNFTNVYNKTLGKSDNTNNGEIAKTVSISKEYDWMDNWLKNRTSILGQNVVGNNNTNYTKEQLNEIGKKELDTQLTRRNNSYIMAPLLFNNENDNTYKSSLRSRLRKYGKTGTNSIRENMELSNQGLMGDYGSGLIYLTKTPKTDKTNAIIHEGSHALGTYNPETGVIKSQSTEIENSKKNIKGWNTTTYDPYLDGGEEIYSRLMETRRLNNIDPNKVWTIEEINNLRKDTNFKDRQIFNRYSNDFILELFNRIAQNNNNTSSFNLDGNRYLAAYGGPINMSSRKPMSPFGNRFNNGGQMFTNGITQINNGGTHEEYKYKENEIYDVSEEEIKLLKKLGYEFEYV